MGRSDPWVGPTHAIRFVAQPAVDAVQPLICVAQANRSGWTGSINRYTRIQLSANSGTVFHPPSIMEAHVLQADLEFQGMLSMVAQREEDRWDSRLSNLRDGGPIDVNSHGDNWWLEHFRFTRHETESLVLALDLPEYIICPESRNREDSKTALCMLLARLTHRSRLNDIEMQFGWERSRFSRFTRLMASTIYSRWKHVLRFDPNRLTREKLAYFGTVIHNKGAPTDQVVGFIDGTIRRIARPVRNQRLVYNGWKRTHCLKYHAIVTPDGLISHIFGPVEGRRHDETLYQQSGIAPILEKHLWSPDGRRLCIYGDPAYGVSGHVLSPYKGTNLTSAESRFNAKMSRCRESVEWGFKEITKQFPYLDVVQNQRLLLSPCGLYYLVAVLLINAHTIFHRPQISNYFGCAPPSLEEYFHGEAVLDEELDEWCMQSAFEEDSQEEDDEEIESIDDI
ncbi:hypothetical protein MIND_00279800 [Mycena indigotica]|uniref:DDE Tnp4 domain-containing protein n=1 Tax=Mycena indigotica TaxID=2126181 RepID=A0A8H6T9G8_9AGAR|nr:uncharacterized protein MIND_00279800 [Mycena indigotica]KAF7312656.1 hypothetical protein MIND_00279800 [Mycena indigotica]